MSYENIASRNFKSTQFAPIPNNTKKKEAAYWGGFFKAAQLAGLTSKQAEGLAQFAQPQGLDQDNEAAEAQGMPPAGPEAGGQGGDITPEDIQALLQNPEVVQLLLQALQAQQGGGGAPGGEAGPGAGLPPQMPPGQG